MPTPQQNVVVASFHSPPALMGHSRPTFALDFALLPDKDKSKTTSL